MQPFPLLNSSTKSDEAGNDFQLETRLLKYAGQTTGTTPGLIAVLVGLEKELAYFESIKEDLLRGNEGGFALIRGENFFGAFNSAAAANQEGVNRFGNQPFLVKRIERQAPPESGNRRAA
ncbi:MAG: hypothetical protein HYX72_11025 [Acidobacteria bacterium]|nr:hypothetical protein [Acidobacteriota bacterium]